jgi:hypothetical protein
MSVFGPKVPAPLQGIIHHAERLCDLLARREGIAAASKAPGETWREGRIEEIEIVVGLVVGDWQAGRVSAEGAARTAASYLDDLHAGAQARLGVDRVLSCCEEDGARTTLVVDDDAETRVLVVRGTTADASAADDTPFHPGSILFDALEQEREDLAPSEASEVEEHTAGVARKGGCGHWLDRALRRWRGDADAGGTEAAEQAARGRR